MNSLKTFWVLPIFVLCLVNTIQLKAQDDKIARITGIILDSETLDPVPYVSVVVKHSYSGTVSDNSGYFTFYAHPKDSVTFSSVGYKSSTIVLPGILTSESYSLLQVLQKDTILLREVEIAAWPTAKEFNKAFLDHKVARGQEDLDAKMKVDLRGTLTDLNEEEKFYYEQLRHSKLYDMTGIAPPNNFLNPITWSNFIRDWRKGVFRENRKKK